MIVVLVDSAEQGVDKVLVKSIGKVQQHLVHRLELELPKQKCPSAAASVASSATRHTLAVPSGESRADEQHAPSHTRSKGLSAVDSLHGTSAYLFLTFFLALMLSTPLSMIPHA